MKIYVKAAIADITTESIGVLHELAMAPDTDVHLLEQLATFGYSNGSTKLLWDIANNPNTPKQLSDDILLDLTEMLNHNNSRKSQILAEHSTDSKFLDFLSQSKDYYTRRAVARNPNTSMTTLSKLAKDSSYQVRAVVADRPNISFETIMALSKDKESMVRIAVAQNPNTPTDILTLMAQDATNLQKNPAIYLALSKNSNISLDALTSMYDILSDRNESYIFDVIHKKLLEMQNKH